MRARTDGERTEGDRPSLVPASMVEHSAAAVAALTFITVVVRGGGRDAGTLVPAVLATVPLLIASRPWRHVPAAVLVLSTVLLAAGSSIGYLTPTGFARPHVVGVIAYGLVVLLSTTAYVRSQHRRTAALVFVCLVGFLQAVAGFVPWQARGIGTVAMNGTFYQPNMFAIFCAAAAVIGWSLAMYERSILRTVGFLTGPPCAAAVVLSASRSVQALLLLSLAALLATTFPPRARTAARRWFVLLLCSGSLLWVGTGPLVLQDDSGSPLAATTVRSGTDSLGGSAAVRAEYWRAAAEQAAEAPWTGQGFGSFGVTFPDRAPVGTFASRYAHNEYLHALAEGGLLYALPLIALTAACGLLCLRRLWKHRLHPGPEVGAAVGALVLLGHAMVDFDWTFMALTGLLGLTGSVALTATLHGPKRKRAGSTAAFLVATAVAVAPLFVVPGLPDNGLSARIEAARALPARLFPDPSQDVAVLRAAAEEPIGEYQAQVRRSLERTQALGDIDPAVAGVRGRVLLALGDVDAALSVLRRAADRSGRAHVERELDYAQALQRAGRDREAVRRLEAALRERTYEGYPQPEAAWQLVLGLRAVAGGESSRTACAFEAVETAFGPRSRPRYVTRSLSSCP